MTRRSRPINGQASFGFGASGRGTLSIVMATWPSSELLIQRNPRYNQQAAEDLGAVPQIWQADQWYRMEVIWKTNGDITGYLYDSDGTTLLNIVTAHDTTITSGGIAFRSFFRYEFPYHYSFDTVEVVPGGSTELP